MTRWTTKTLGEVCSFVRGPFGGSLKKSVFVKDGYAVYEQQHAIYDQFEQVRYFIDDAKFREMKRFELRPNDLIMSCSGTMGRVAIVPHTIKPGIINQALLKLTPSPAVSGKFLKYWMNSTKFQDSLKEQSGGAAIQNVASVSVLKEIRVALPPLSEQQRIVGLLDEAFAYIATAKANAKKNLQNARALFQSHLQSVFTQRRTEWAETKLEDVCGFQNGFAFQSSTFRPTGAPILRISNIQNGRIDTHSTFVFFDPKDYGENLDRYRIVKDDLLIAMSGATTGKLGFNTESTIFYLNQRVGKFEPGTKLNKQFLYYFLTTKVKENLRISAGAAQPNLSTEQIKAFVLPVPSIDLQTRIVEAFESLYQETQRLESIYKRKLTALEELKNSLLHQAFTGQLTAEQSVVVTFPISLPNTTTTDLHAGVLAMAYQLHEQNGKLQHFTHVKAEKIAHMVEARLGIDLGRAPVKDAAGPNDFPHLNKVEHRARKANYFDFRQVPGAAYKLKKLGGFDRLIDRTRGALGDHREEMETLLQWMLSLTPRQAEIVATVFAAWNNLLLDGTQPSDEQIVYESREDWHPNKLKIERKKFFAAVQWLRQQGVVPEGKGRYVDKPRK